MTGDDLDPVMGRAIAADGVGTVIASAVGGSPTTTYAENIGVMAATRVYSTAAYYVAAVVAILLGFIPKFGAIVAATPGGVLGGITLVLYGMIGLLGAKIWVENGVDFADPVNLVPGRGRASSLASAARPGLRDHRRLLPRRHRPGHHPDHRRLPPRRAVAPKDRATARSMAVGHGAHEDELRRTAKPGGHVRVPSEAVKPPPFAYHRPGTVAEAVAALAGWRLARRCSPAARAWCRCCRCGSPPRPRSSTSTASPASTASTSTRRRRPDRRAGPARRRARLRRRTPVSRWSPWRSPTSPTRRSATGAPRSARSCTPTPAAEMPVVLRLLGGTSTSRAGGSPHDPGRPSSTSARSSRRSATTRSRSSAFFPALRRGRGRLRGDRPPARRLRAGRRRRAGPGDGCGRVPLRSDVPTVVDLTGRGRRRTLRRGRARAPRPGGRHPRHRRLPRPARAGADRRVDRGRRDGRCPHERGAARRPPDRQRRAARPALPARRLLSDALRHDLGLTGTHVGCEHGVCGACTVLVDGRPMRSCLMFAVSADGAEITTVEGLTGRRRLAGAGAAGVPECHGLQCGFCTPGFLTTITAGLRDNPTPTHEEAREMIAGNLCRCTGYQNIVGGRAGGCERGRALGRRRGGAAGPQAVRRDARGRGMTTKLSASRSSASRTSGFLRGKGRYVDDVARPRHPARRGAPLAARPRPDRRHRRRRRARPRGRARRLDLRRPGRLSAMAEPLPLLIPHPTLTHGRTQYALAKDEVNYVGEAIAFVVADDRYVAEDAVGGSGSTTSSCRRRRHRGRPRRPSTWCTTTCPATSAPGWSRRRRRRGRHRRRAAPAEPRPDHRAQRLHADGGPRRRPLGPRRRRLTGVDVDPDLDRRPAGASPPSSASTSARST